MKMGSERPALMVALPETTVARLMALRGTSDKCIADVVDRMLPAPTPAPPTSPSTEDTQQTSVVPQGKDQHPLASGVASASISSDEAHLGS